VLENHCLKALSLVTNTYDLLPYTTRLNLETGDYIYNVYTVHVQVFKLIRIY
jgi:hypothetical protein